MKVAVQEPTTYFIIQYKVSGLNRPSYSFLIPGRRVYMFGMVTSHIPSYLRAKY